MKPSLFIILFTLFCSCKKEKTIVWDEAAFDSKISGNPVYQKLNTQKEILAVYEHDTSMRRTSDVTFMKEYDGANSVQTSKHYNCRSYYFNPEILTINVGLGSGLGGDGFIINYKNGKFYTEPYFYTDLDPDKKKELVYELIGQTLTLDKPQYQLGDSLYGKINFHILETNKGRQTELCANGFFRTKISKQAN